jgi:hypothetical protein
MKIRSHLSPRWRTRLDLLTFGSVAALISLSTILGSNADDNTSRTFQFGANGQKIKVVIGTEPFRKASHNIQTKGEPIAYLIDGQTPIGTSGNNEAQTQFSNFEVFWNDKKIDLRREAWSAIFNVPLRLIEPLRDNASGLAIVPSSDGGSILFYFRPNVGDSEPEGAWLVVDQTGTWRRFHSWELVH